MDSEESLVPVGCETCPNRQKKKDKARGQVVTIIFALFTIAIALSSFVKREPNGGIGFDDTPDYTRLVGFTTVTAFALGINIPTELLGAVAGVVLKSSSSNRDE